MKQAARVLAGVQPAWADVAAAVVLVIGLAVAAGWLADIAWLVQLAPQYAPTQLNTAVGLCLGALGVLAAPRRRLLVPCLVAAALLLVIGGLSLAQYLLGLDLGIDELLLRHDLQVRTSHPGRMAPNTAFAFLILALALAVHAWHRSYRGSQALPLAAAGLVAVMGLVTLVGYVLNLSPGQGAVLFTDMAVPTALGLSLLGGALALRAWPRRRPPAGGSLGSRAHFLILLILAVSLNFWQVLVDYQQRALAEYMMQELEQVDQSLQQAMSYRLQALARQAERQTWSLAAPEADRRRWREDAGQYLRDFDTISALAWLDRDGHPHAALRRNEVTDTAAGWLAAEPAAQALATAAAEQRPALSPPFEVDGEIAMFAAVPEVREGNLYGYVAALLQLDAVLALTDLDTEVVIEVADGSGRVLFSRGELAAPTVTVVSGLYGANLRLVLGPAETMLQRLATPLPEFLLLGGGLLAGLMLLLLQATGRARWRQAEAEAAQQRLRSEVDERSRLQAHLGERNRELEQALHAIQNIMDYSLDVICTFNARGEFIEVSRASEQVWGYSPDELRGRSYRELVDPADLEADRGVFARLFNDQAVTNYENHYLHRDGHTVTMLWSAAWSAETRCIYASGRDITRYRETRQALESANRQLLEAQRIARLGNWELDVSCNHLYWSAEVYRIFGVDDDAFAGTHEAFMQYMHPDDVAAYESARRQVLEGTAPLDIVHRIVRPDGDLRWVHERGEPVRAATGEVMKLVGTVQDVTELHEMQAELEASERRFRQLFDQSPQPLLLFSSSDYRFLAVNDAALAQYGYTRREFLRLNLMDLIPEADQAATRTAIGTAGTFRQRSLWRHRRRDGSLMTVEISSHVADIDGRPARLALAQDVTEREAARVRLEQHEHQLRELAATAVDVHRQMQAVDTLQLVAEQARMIIGAHQAVVSFSGDPGQVRSVYGQSMSDEYAARGDDSVSADGSGIAAEVCETNRPQRLTRAELEQHPRWHGVGEQPGGDAPVHGWLAVPLVDSAERNIGLIQLYDKRSGEFDARDEAILVQLAQMAAAAVEKNRLLQQVRRQAAELEEKVRERTAELATSESRYRSLAEAAPQILWRADSSARAVYVNPAWARLTGLPVEQALDWGWFSVMHPEDRVRAYKQWQRARRRDSYLQGECRMRRADGGYAVLAYVAAPVHDSDGQIESWVGISSDISARVAAETELRAVNQELEAFTYSVSHDLRAPLRHMAGFTQLLHNHSYEQLDTRARHYLDIVEDAARRMGHLIDDLLSFAHAGRKVMERRPVDMDALVAEVIGTLPAEAGGTAVEWEAQPLGEVQGDPGLLRLVWENLLANALKFSRQRQPARINVGQYAGADHETVFFVRDNGVGFDMRYVAKLFRVFQRLHSQDEFEGTGIGLANVQRIVQRHGGRVWAESALGEGACFYFTLSSERAKET